ncbi:protein of unknown function [Caballeronia sp. S22]
MVISFFYLAVVYCGPVAWHRLYGVVSNCAERAIRYFATFCEDAVFRVITAFALLFPIHRDARRIHFSGRRMAAGLQ